MIDGFEDKVIEIEAVPLEVFEEVSVASERFANLAEKAAVLVVEERAAMRRRFAHEQSRDAVGPIAGASFFEGGHAIHAVAAFGADQKSLSWWLSKWSMALA